METKADLLRGLLLRLERMQRSPPEPIFIDFDEWARACDEQPEDIEFHLEHLASQGFIEGPGTYPGGLWLFRKVTKKGVALISHIRGAKDWNTIKRAHGQSE